MRDCWRWLFDHNIIKYIVHKYAIGSLQFTANQTEPECNVPAGCTPDHINAYNPIVCDNNGNIEDDCSETTTPPPPSPTTPPATPPHRPKHCRHIVP